MKSNKKKLQKPPTLRQWLEIRTVNGEVKIDFYPPNKELERVRQSRDPAPELIYRYMFFVNGVPNQFNWIQPDEQFRQYGGLFLQRFLVEEWPTIMQLEKEVGHKILARPRKPQRRPEAWGPCPCKRCTAEREREEAA